MNKIAVLAVHPDDETLGCGGTLLKHKKNGDDIFWIIATTIRKDKNYTPEEIKTREEEIKRVSGMYNFKEVYQLDIPTTKVDEISMRELIEKISAVLEKIKPSILYLPFYKDVHSDHRKIFESAYSCIKTFRFMTLKKIMMMETISETEFSPCLPENTFNPNYFVDISDFLEKKQQIIKMYVNEIGFHPFPRNVENIKALATFRGSTAGCKYAESFMILKEIW